MSDILGPDQTDTALDGTAFSHLGDVLLGSYSTRDFAASVRLLDAVAVLADELNHHPDVRVGYGTIEFELSSHDVDGVTQRDVDLALRIQQVADDQGAESE
ncbi:4a-hydroxytetrahydrobiopterin dehydratase [Glaciibacter flavus]|nr:4a-hydroxytetrahydrobiopterin dehydratase [Glaciibacter flavus]